MFKTERMTCIIQDLNGYWCIWENTTNNSEIGTHDLTTCELHTKQMHYIRQMELDRNGGTYMPTNVLGHNMFLLLEKYQIYKPDMKNIMKSSSKSS